MSAEFVPFNAPPEVSVLFYTSIPVQQKFVNKKQRTTTAVVVLCFLLTNFCCTGMLV